MLDPSLGDLSIARPPQAEGASAPKSGVVSPARAKAQSDARGGEGGYPQASTHPGRRSLLLEGALGALGLSELNQELHQLPYFWPTFSQGPSSSIHPSLEQVMAGLAKHAYWLASTRDSMYGSLLGALSCRLRRPVPPANLTCNPQ